MPVVKTIVMSVTISQSASEVRSMTNLNDWYKFNRRHSTDVVSFTLDTREERSSRRSVLNTLL